jgi:hypothetical protein
MACSPTIRATPLRTKWATGLDSITPSPADARTRALLRRLQYAIRHRRVERDLRKELEVHVALKREEFEGLRHLVEEVGVGQIVYGTDVAFNWPVTVDPAPTTNDRQGPSGARPYCSSVIAGGRWTTASAYPRTSPPRAASR